MEIAHFEKVDLPRIKAIFTEDRLHCLSLTIPFMKSIRIKFFVSLDRTPVTPARDKLIKLYVILSSLFFRTFLNIQRY